jgi:copper transport protein
VLAIIQVGTLGALIDTVYGRLLLAKLAAFAGLLSLATLNRFHLTPALARGDPVAQTTLTRSVLAELALIYGIIVLTALLGAVPPPRALAEAAASQKPSSSMQMSVADGVMAHLTVSPGVAGTNEITVEVMDDAGGPLDPLQVALRLSSAPSGVEPITRPATRVGPGQFVLTGPELGIAGTWQIEAEILISDFKRVRVPFRVEIRSR